MEDVYRVWVDVGDLVVVDDDAAFFEGLEGDDGDDGDDDE